MLSATEQLTEDLGREPTAEEIRVALGWDRQHYDTVLTTMTQVRHTSLDRPVHPGADPRGTTLGDLVDLTHPEEDPENNDLSLVETRVLLELALDCLSTRERLVVNLSFVEQRSQAAISRTLGVTHKQVTHTLDQALDKLRAAVGEPPTRVR